VAGMRARATILTVVALGLAGPANAAAERLPVFAIVATGTIEHVWDYPKTVDLEDDCWGQEYIEGAGSHAETWTSLPVRVKVRRWRDGELAISQSAEATGSATRTARLLRSYEPGPCSRSDPWVKNQAGGGMAHVHERRPAAWAARARGCGEAAERAASPLSSPGGIALPGGSPAFARIAIARWPLLLQALPGFPVAARVDSLRGVAGVALARRARLLARTTGWSAETIPWSSSIPRPAKRLRMRCSTRGSMRARSASSSTIEPGPASLRGALLVQPGLRDRVRRGGVGDYCPPSVVAFSFASEVSQRCLMSREAMGAASLPRPLKLTSSSTRREVPTGDGLRL
jgi:hypothetical protein